ncbi:uncharacterized protein [Hemitrygon akajei]|uniref:uncharacterized protein n=1 Tax=Hemitrygon akajei TaxID=2704970 RepID=UPI003BFA02A2
MVIRKMIPHPEFNSKSPENDIMLVQRHKAHEILTNIFNISLEQFTVPAGFKVTTIIPVPKNTTDRVEEAGGVAVSQMEMNMKCESERLRLWRELKEAEEKLTSRLQEAEGAAEAAQAKCFKKNSRVQLMSEQYYETLRNIFKPSNMKDSCKFLLAIIPKTSVARTKDIVASISVGGLQSMEFIIDWSSGDHKVSDLSYVTCGSVIKLLNTLRNVRLHSHEVKYGSGNGQQSVTGVTDANDSNSYWRIRGKSDIVCQRGTYWERKNSVRFKRTVTEVLLSTTGEQYERPINGQCEVHGLQYSNQYNSWKVMEGIFMKPMKRPKAGSIHSEL